MTQTHTPIWLRHAKQRLAVLPTLGGGVAAWQLERDTQEPLDLWRRWDGVTADMYQLASFAMVPWSNRIGQQGFECGGHVHPMHPNRAGEPYPIHGDGWLQPWQWDQTGPGAIEMTLQSHHHAGGPYAYRAKQRFALVPGGLEQSIEVQHLGAAPLPYGLGLHPWFPRAADTRVQANVDGVWLSGADPMPTNHSHTFPDSWDLNQGIPATGTLIDNGYTGWQGTARIEWPDRGLCVTLEQVEPETGERFCLVYRPPVGNSFCFEPITHPIDAFHIDGRPGLRVLEQGQSMRLDVRWRIEALA